MAECTQKNLYGSMTWCPGKSRTPGIRKRVYFTPKSSIVKWPTHDVTKPADKGKYNGDFELAEGEYWQYMDLVVNDSKFNAESQGDFPCKSFLQHGEFFYPGLEEDITDFEEKAINDDLVYIVQQASGKFKVLGCEEYQTNTNFSSASGNGATDKIGVTITPECNAPFDLLVYEGKIMIGANEDANEASA